MGRFECLGDAARVLAAVISDKVGPDIDVRVGAPLDGVAPAQTVNVTLLWTTANRALRDSPRASERYGLLTRSPLLLKAFFLVTTSGAAGEEQALDTYDLLGRVVQIFHATPMIELPCDGLGEGQLRVFEQEVGVESAAKIFSALRVTFRAGVVLDLSPIELSSEAQGEPVATVPGGAS